MRNERTRARSPAASKLSRDVVLGRAAVAAHLRQVKVSFKSRPGRNGTVGAAEEAVAAMAARARGPLDSQLSIGDLVARSGVAASALRYYEALGLITAVRSGGNQRRYPRHVLRRVAFVRAGRQLGLSLAEIRGALASLPDGKAPTRADWTRAARAWQSRLDEKIAELQRIRSTLTDCIGCGCLSLRRCALYNPGDTAAALGPGARWLLGDEPPA